jgi:hypothetical protein
VFRKEWGFDSLHGHQPSLAKRVKAARHSFGEGGLSSCRELQRASHLSSDGGAAKASRRSPQGEDGLIPMRYACLLESIEFPDQTYVGLTYAGSGH